VSDEYENDPNVSTVRQPSLYLPAWQSDLAANEGMLAESWENLPGSDFVVGALGSAYLVGTGIGTTGPDYSGTSNMAMWTRWQTLTNSSITAAKIPNLIFTDYAAAVVVGTKGVLGPGNSAGESGSVDGNAYSFEDQISLSFWDSGVCDRSIAGCHYADGAYYGVSWERQHE
jgi:hypothetical protein